MWASGALGVHNYNMPALERAYVAIERVIGVVSVHTPEQFCASVALSRDGRTIRRHRLPLRNYNDQGSELFARQRLEAFFERVNYLPVSQQIESAAKYRVWRAPLDLLMQRDIWHF